MILLGQELDIQGEPEYIIWYDFIRDFFEIFDKKAFEFKLLNSGGLHDQDQFTWGIMRICKMLYVDLTNNDPDIVNMRNKNASN
jgi:hypothetical protein